MSMITNQNSYLISNKLKTMRKKTTTFILIVLYLCTIACSTYKSDKKADNNNEKISQLTEWIESSYEGGEFSGVVIYAEKGQIKYQQCLGFADVEKKRSLTPNSSFNLASISKQFTATAIMLLMQEGKIEFDQTAQTYLPEFPYSFITVRHLLNHTSGLADHEVIAEIYWDKSKTYSNNDMLAYFSKNKPALKFEPGSEYCYSNTGYVVLSLITARVSGTKFETFLSQHIFQPLNMKNTRIFNLLSSDKTFDNRVFGKYNSNLNDLIYIDGTTGDGNVYSSANDLLIWDQAIYQNKLIEKEIQDEAFMPVTLTNGEKSYYGFGWIIEENAVSHTGSWVGFRNYFHRDFEKNSVTIILSNNNSTYSSKGSRETIIKLLKRAFGT